MIVLFFSCFDPNGIEHAFSCGGDDIEYCLDVVIRLVKANWKIISVDLSESSGCMTRLPAEAFDEESLSEPLQLLQREWETILSGR